MEELIDQIRGEKSLWIIMELKKKGLERLY